MLGVFGDGRSVRGQEELRAVVHHADSQRRTLAGAHQLFGMAFVDHGDGVSAVDEIQRLTHGVAQIAAVLLLGVFDELHQHFGVGLALEVVALALELLAQCGVVFDDAVVHQRDMSGFRHVGMGVGLRGHAVCGPSRVGDAQRALHRSGRSGFGGHVFQVRHLAFGLVHLEALLREQGASGGVVSAVFQAVKTFHENGVSLTLSDISYYSAHSSLKQLIEFTYFRFICIPTTSVW